MNREGTSSGALTFGFGEARLQARPAGTLWWPAERVLAVADLHLGRAERMARLGGGLLPPYETEDTLKRLEAEVTALSPRSLVMLGDSFDDLTAAAALSAQVIARLERLAAGRRLLWIAGNHDPGPVDLPGSHLIETRIGGISLRHIAEPERDPPEISGHYHPKAKLMVRGRQITRKCFLLGQGRLVMPAFGTYTGGLDVRDPAFASLTGPDSHVLVLGRDAVRAVALAA
ncbi:MAG: ligase-associated DNA damage response endonuclease PdeM [Pseudomonadota bacterium]